MFMEAASSGKRELVLRKDSVTEKVARAVEGGEDSSLFSVTSLNNLLLSGFRGLPQLSHVGSLTALLRLSLTENQLQTLPEEIGSLSKLRLLDVSRNELSSLPPSLFLLPSLQSLILSSNSLVDSSFPAELSGEVLPSLHQLDVTGNNLTALPSFLSLTPQLAELHAAHNSLSSLDPSLIQTLAGLRVLEAQDNRLSALPHQLTGCSKLKTLQLGTNPLKDRRLLKLVAQHGTHKPKAVLDYLGSRAPHPPPGREGGKKRGKGKVVVQAEESEEGSDVEFSLRPPEVVVLRPGRGVEVVATGNARRVRPYLVCAVVRGVGLAGEDSMKQFLSLQTKLHDTVCKRRRSATIATHDLAKVSPPITYLVAPATDITMTPLGWSEEVKVQHFLSHVETNKPGSGGRKTKGVDTAAASLFKYLQYVSSEEMVYLQDQSEAVISLPPLTNSENSKVSESTTDLLVEVTSSESLLAAKTVMDALVVGVATMIGEGGLRLEQVKVVDEARQLLVLYPSRTDLTNSTDIRVTRPV